jgi:D-psicose/D-tagatose/L-ribulose 3-epimerase
MRFGVNTFVWESPFSTERHLSLVHKAARMGFDWIEIAVEEPALVDVGALHAAADEAQIGLILCGAFGPGRNLSNADSIERRAADTYLRWMIDAAAVVGSPVIGGPMYSAVGKPRLETQMARAGEWQRAAEGLRRWGDYAGERGVRLAFEPLNRFETDMVNIVEQGLALIEAAGCAAVGLHLDTFHMHLEEKNSAAAIRQAGDRLFHFHACENDRGVPGTGQVHWQEVAAALQEIYYEGAVVIESFTPQVASIARAVCIWRVIAPDQDTIARDGLAFLKSLFGSDAAEAR